MFFASFFFLPLFLTIGSLTSVFKDNKSLKSRKDAEIKVFFKFCLLMEVQYVSGSGSGRPKNFRIRNTPVLSCLLERHMMDHTGQRPHPCEECKLSFKTSNSLKKHKLSVHSQVKQFACQVCQARYIYASLMKDKIKLPLVSVLDS
jgi:hypothetical protein